MTGTLEPGGVTAMHPGGSVDLLASDADRDAAAGLLTDAFAAGRLTAGEHGERVQAAYAARTCAELAGLTADLPRADRTGAIRRPANGDQRAAGLLPAAIERCLRCVLLCLCPPVGIAWLLARRGSLGGHCAPPAAPGDAGANAEDR